GPCCCASERGRRGVGKIYCLRSRPPHTATRTREIATPVPLVLPSSTARSVPVPCQPCRIVGAGCVKPDCVNRTLVFESSARLKRHDADGCPHRVPGALDRIDSEDGDVPAQSKLGHCEREIEAT